MMTEKKGWLRAARDVKRKDAADVTWRKTEVMKEGEEEREDEEEGRRRKRSIRWRPRIK